MLTLGLAQTAHAQNVDNPAVHVVAYVDVIPPSKDDGAALLKSFREASRQDDGNLRFELLQRKNRPNQFVILETWRDQSAFDAHAKAAHTGRFRETLQPLLGSPYDARPHKGLVTDPARAARADGANGAVYVVTHVDIVPTAKDQGQALLEQLADASRKDDGNLRFELLQQNSRPNHFTLVEAWKDQTAFEAHAMAAHTRQFRDRHLPLTGSLYDERLYARLD
jgi:quinol monooxygenase YgiN